MSPRNRKLDKDTPADIREGVTASPLGSPVEAAPREDTLTIPNADIIPEERKRKARDADFGCPPR